MTAFLECIWIFTQIGFASFRNLTSSFGKKSQPFCTVLLGASFIYFSNFSKFGTWIPDFSDSRPKKIGFGAWGRFCLFLFVCNFTDLFTVWTIFYKFSPMLHKSFSYEPSLQYGISPFKKTIINKSKYSICKIGIGKIRIFLLNCLLNCLDCLLPRVGFLLPSRS